MIAKISSVHFCPIKSLSFQSAQTLIIKKDIGIVEDRIFAFSRGLNELNAIQVEKNPDERKLIHFLIISLIFSFSTLPKDLGNFPLVFFFQICGTLSHSK